MICNFEIYKMGNENNDSNKYYISDKIDTAIKNINFSYFKKLHMNENFTYELHMNEKAF